MGQSNGVLLKEVAAFERCPLIEVSLWSIDAPVRELDVVCTPCEARVFRVGVIFVC